jgi:uroporphyrinogen-III synthase
MAGRRLPLEGRKVLVLRPEGLGRELAVRLGSLGARVDLRPAIAFEPPADPAPCREAIAALERYDRVVLTSPTGVRFFVQGVEEAGWRPEGLRTPVAAVGSGTARALRQAGIEPEVIAEDSRAEGLAAALRAHVGRGERVLLVRPERTREILAESLAAMGARVDAVAFYRTVASPESQAAALAVARGAYDAVIFTSPSTFLRLREAGGGEAFDAGLRRARRVAIGGVTAEALSAAGFAAAAVAERPTVEAMVEAVLAALSS